MEVDGWKHSFVTGKGVLDRNQERKINRFKGHLLKTRREMRKRELDAREHINRA